MKVVPKTSSGRRVSEPSDNTRVSSSPIRRTELAPNSFFNDEGEIVTIKPSYAYFTKDNRTDYQRELDKLRSRWQEEDRLAAEGMELLPAFLKFISPSTYIGPIFNNNDKSYIDNVLEGNASGSKELDAAIDIATPVVGGVTKGAAKGVSRYVSNVEKRAIETAMRTAPLSSPLNSIAQGVELMLLLRNGGPERLIRIGDYILRGKRVGPKGYYNSFAFYDYDTYHKTFKDRLKNFLDPKGSVNFYTGFSLGSGNLNLENDIIDAYLYLTPINPKYGLKRVDPDYGIHLDYISKNYPNKDIPVYEVERTDYVPDEEVTAGKWESVGIGHFFPEWISRTRHHPDVGGHLMLTGTYNGKTVTRSQDIWKFNPADYYKKWFSNDEYYQKLPWILKYMIKKGLQVVDRVGTPIVTRTRWTPETSMRDIYPSSNDLWD